MTAYLGKRVPVTVRMPDSLMSRLRAVKPAGKSMNEWLTGRLERAADRQESQEEGRVVERKSVTQDWVCGLSFMQQAVLLSAIRGCDGIPKRHKAKALVRWYRRCVLLSAFDGRALTDPFEPGGGSFTGPVATIPDVLGVGLGEAGGRERRESVKRGALARAIDDFVDSRDELPAHYVAHAMHAFEVVGYKHPDADVRAFWLGVYSRIVNSLHVWPETEAQMDARLGDDEEGWRARGDDSSCCSD